MATILADTPIPSIEVGTQPEHQDARASASPPSALSRSSSPSRAVLTPNTSPSTNSGRVRSPANNEEIEDDGPQNNPREASELNQELADMRLSPSSALNDMEDLSGAIEDVRRTPSEAAVSRARSESLRPETARHRQRSRRSSSRVEVQRYQVSDEEGPDDTFFSAEFQRAFTDAKSLMSSMEAALASASLHLDEGSTIHRLHKEASDLARYRYPTTRRVGFVGDSGAGKSSSLNSLLDVKGLARTSNSGEACTCVVTEYHYSDSSELSIRVDLFTEEELHVQIRSLLRDYRHFHFRCDDMERVEKADCQKKSDLAKDVFKAMFRGRLIDEVHLLAESEDAVLGDLFRWAREMRPSDQLVASEGLNVEQCAALLSSLSTERPEKDQAAAWPYIKAVKVFMKAHILSKGLVLVDLPGLRDLNAARRNITEKYLLECNEIFVVCEIGRAASNQTVRDVFELSKRIGVFNATIMCTKSDVIEAEEARRDWGNEEACIIREYQTDIAEMQQELKSINVEIQAYEEDEEEEELIQEDQEYVRKLRIDARRLKEQHYNRSHELESYLMRTRNAKVTQNIREGYSDQVPANHELRVFCVSNSHYWNHRSDPLVTARSQMELSGVVEARRHCVSIIADCQHRAATLYIRTQVQDLLRKVDLWVRSGARTADDERKEAIQKILDEAEGEITRGLSSRSFSRSFASSLKNTFLEEIYKKRDASLWCHQAEAAARSWRTMHPMTYSSFCRHYGDHATAATRRVRINWNYEAISKMVDDLEDPWQAMLVQLEQHRRHFDSHVNQINNSAHRKLEGAAELDDDEVAESLIQSLSAQADQLSSDLERQWDELEDNVNLVRIEALTGISSSMIVQALAPSYEQCNLDSGGGSDARRKDIMSRAVSNRTLFTTLMRDFRDLFNNKVNQVQKQMEDSASSYLASVRETLDLVRTENACRESTQNPLFRDRIAEEVGLSMQSLERIQGVISV